MNEDQNSQQETQQQSDSEAQTGNPSEVQGKPGSAPQFHFENILMKRFIATFIDLVLVGTAATIILIPAMLILPRMVSAFFAFFVFAAAATAVLLKDMPYKIAAVDLDGQSPGKKAMNIRVTDLNKNPITMQQSIQRNLIPASGYVIAAISSLIHIIPFDILTGIAGLFIITPLMLISMIANLVEIYKIFSAPQHRRIGDQMANTIVAWE